MLEINFTLTYQIVSFFILFYVLNRFLYRPVFAILEARKKKIEGALKSAASTEENVKKGLIDYEKRLKEAAVGAQEERAKIRQAALDKEALLIEKARNETEAEIAKIKKEIEKSKVEAVKSLKAEAPAISKTIAEKILDRKVAAFLVFFLIPLIPPIALAAEEGLPGSAAAIYWRIFNFILLAAGVVIIWKKFIKGYLETRSGEIKKAIEDAEKTKAEAEEKLKEYEAKLAGLTARAGEIREKIRSEAEAEKERIIKEAYAAVDKLRDSIALASEQEVKKARVEIRNAAAEYVIEAAREILSKEIKPEDRDRIAKSYIEKLRISR